MYKFSIAPSDFLAPTFEDKLRLCSRTGCAYVEIDDTIEGVFLGDMDGETIETMRNLLIDYGKIISLVTYTGCVCDKERFKKLLRTAHLLGVKSVKIGFDGFEDVHGFTSHLNICAAYAKCYGIKVCIENKNDSILERNRVMELVVKNAENEILVIFNPMCFAYMRSHPFFHEFYSSRIKNNILFLRVSDGLFCERKPTMPGCGNAEIKELASILLSRSYDGYFSFTDYVGGMSEEELLSYIAAFKTLLKNM